MADRKTLLCMDCGQQVTNLGMHPTCPDKWPFQSTNRGGAHKDKERQEQRNAQVRKARGWDW